MGNQYGAEPWDGQSGAGSGVRELGGKSWSLRALAKSVGLSTASVARAWRERWDCDGPDSAALELLSPTSICQPLPCCNLRGSHKTGNHSSMLCCRPLRVIRRVGGCEAVAHIRLAHSLLAYPVRSDTAPRGWSVPLRPPAQRLFHTTATWESLHFCGNGVKSFAHNQPFFQSGKVFHGLHHEGVIRRATGYMERLGRHGTCVKARTPWADVFDSLLGN